MTKPISQKVSNSASAGQGPTFEELVQEAGITFHGVYTELEDGSLGLDGEESPKFDEVKAIVEGMAKLTPA